MGWDGAGRVVRYRFWLFGRREDMGSCTGDTTTPIRAVMSVQPMMSI